MDFVAQELAHFEKVQKLWPKKIYLLDSVSPPTMSCIRALSNLVKIALYNPQLKISPILKVQLKKYKRHYTKIVQSQFPVKEKRAILLRNPQIVPILLKATLYQAKKHVSKSAKVGTPVNVL